MTQPKIPKHQHWVPKFYLTYFATQESRCTETPQAWRFDKESNAFDEKPTSVRNLCGKRYLYSPKNTDGVRDGGTEDFLRQIEDQTAWEWPTIAEGEADLKDPRLRNLIARFVAAMQLRNYTLYTLFNSTIELANELDPLPKGFVRADGVNPRNSGEVFIRQLRDGLPKMTDTFLSKTWYVLDAPNDSFVTSDKPVLFIHPSRMPGPGTPDAIAALPFGPRRVLMMEDKERLPANTYQAANHHFIQLFSREMLRRSNRIIITGRPPADVELELEVEASRGQ